MLPKIIFEYSSVYDNHYKEYFELLFPGKDIYYPSSSDVLETKKDFEKEFKVISKIILDSISNISCLDWKSKFVKAYIVGKARPISSPLTIPIRIKGVRLEDFNEVRLDILVHELIHVILSDNHWQSFTKFHEEFKSESQVTKIHILVHAIHKEIYLRHFSIERLNFDINRSKSIEDYYRSWEIVNEFGTEKILELCR